MSEIKAMLASCAPGHWMKEGEHNWIVYFGEHIFRNLPKGKHGKRKNPDIQIGHVRTMVRLFKIYDCAKHHIESL